MTAVLYYLALPFIYLLSILPFSWLYFLSDLTFVFLYHVTGYRKGVVKTNLRNAFPGKTEKELTDLSKKFYHHLCDLFLETFKLLSISKRGMLKHCSFSPASRRLLDRLAAEKKSAILVMGHMGNWEWAGNAFSLLFRQQLFIIYHPLKNAYFNRLAYRMRTRFGSRLIAMKDTYRDMLIHKDTGGVTVFVADQTPQPTHAYWTSFLNQDTPVFRGTEKIAQKMNTPVIYACVKKIKRGYYEVEVEMLVEEPVVLKPDEISEMHTRRLEKDILAQPEIWLWSHRRWKHQRKKQQEQTVQDLRN